MPVRVTHLTSVHSRKDIRIVVKQCGSLSAAGYDVHLVVADGLGNELNNSITVHDVGNAGGRIHRMIHTKKAVLRKAIELDSDIYHFHDPELIPVGIKLKKHGKKVIYDIHEDTPRQIKTKEYLYEVLRPLVAKGFEIYENHSARQFDAVVTATPFIQDRFIVLNGNTVNISNFPIVEELKNDIDWTRKKNEISYIGGITAIRGIRQLIDALELVQNDVVLNLAGSFSEKNFEEEVKQKKGWSRVRELGFIDRDGVRTLLSNSAAGVVTFLPVSNHVNAQPNKMFEYMVAGVPVIASDFPLWKSIVEGKKCGICVNPLDPVQIAKAIDYILHNPGEAEAMAINGQKAVLNKYNWNIEEAKLLALYNRLVEGIMK